MELKQPISKSETAVETSPQPSSKATLKKVMLVIATLTLLLTALVEGYFLLTRKNKTCLPCINNQQKSWVKPVSSVKATPVIKKNVLYLYSVESKELKKTDYTVSDTKQRPFRIPADDIEVGDSSLQVSPDGFYTIFFNFNDSDTLYLISNETLEVRKITQVPNALTAIIGWSPDSSKFVYKVFEDNVSTRSMPIGTDMPHPTTADFDKEKLPGYYVFDIITGANTYLYPLIGAEVINFASPTKIILSFEKEFALFDIDSFTVDYTFEVDTDKNLSPKIGDYDSTKTKDGKKWAFFYEDPDNNEISGIIYADYPNKNGETVVRNEGKIGDPIMFYDKPLLSPSGKYLAFVKHIYVDPDGKQVINVVNDEEDSSEDEEKTYIKIWDTDSKNVIRELEGYPDYWLDDKNLSTSAGIFSVETGDIDKTTEHDLDD